MSYQIRIAERIGPILTAALDGMPATRLPPGTCLTIVSLEPPDVAGLTRRLLELGSVIDSIRVQGPTAASARRACQVGLALSGPTSDPTER